MGKCSNSVRVGYGRQRHQLARPRDPASYLKWLSITLQMLLRESSVSGYAKYFQLSAFRTCSKIRDLVRFDAGTLWSLIDVGSKISVVVNWILDSKLTTQFIDESYITFLTKNLNEILENLKKFGIFGLQKVYFGGILNLK